MTQFRLVPFAGPPKTGFYVIGHLFHNSCLIVSDWVPAATVQNDPIAMPTPRTIRARFVASGRNCPIQGRS